MSSGKLTHPLPRPISLNPCEERRYVSFAIQNGNNAINFFFFFPISELLRFWNNPDWDLIRGHFKYTPKMNEWFTNSKKGAPSRLWLGVGGAVYSTKDSGSGFTKEKQILNQDREKVSI